MIKALKQYLANTLDTSVYEDETRSLKLACTVMMFEVLRADANTLSLIHISEPTRLC